MMRKHRWCNVIGTMLGAAALAPILIMLLDRRQPLELIEGAIKPYEVRAGQEIRVVWSAIERRPCDGVLRRIFIDSAGTVHPSLSEPTVYHLTFTDKRTFQRIVTVPKGMTAGQAIYTSKIERWCNPLQRYLWPIASDGLKIPFVVIED